MTVKELFSHVGISNFGCVRWGEHLPCSKPGIYMVSTSKLPEEPAFASQPNFNDAAIQKWIDRLPGFRIDGVPPPHAGNFKKRVSPVLASERKCTLHRANNKAPLKTGRRIL